MALDTLKKFVTSGGPDPEDYDLISSIFPSLQASGASTEVIREIFAETMTAECIHGHGFLKPHGYPGDFEIIDKIYTAWVSDRPHLMKWDMFFHAQPAPVAVRNRKTYFKQLLKALPANAKVLNIASGPSRDVFEFLSENPFAKIKIDCLDLDEKALAFSRTLCSDYSSRVSFTRANALRYRTNDKYDLIWSAGLFDYFNDKIFIRLLRRLLAFTKPAGRVVIGNFSDNNPSKAYMEVLADWNLQHRSKETLLALATAAGADSTRINVDKEDLGINLFLRIDAALD